MKPILFKTLPALVFWVWAHTGAKLVGWIAELGILLSTFLGGWKAWSAKKLMRQGVRFLVGLSARFIAVSVLLNLLFGHERRGVKSLPGFAIQQLHKTWFGRVLRWWSNTTERQKRLALGVVLCVILVLAGQAVLGISVLLFDLAWELLLLLWRLVTNLWRFASPYLLKLVPNFIGNFVTKKIIPLVTSVVPIIKDDHRVIYMRFNSRRVFRQIKAWLYLKSRSRREAVRKRISPLVSDKLRARKTALFDDANRVSAKKSANNKAFDDDITDE